MAPTHPNPDPKLFAKEREAKKALASEVAQKINKLRSHSASVADNYLMKRTTKERTYKLTAYEVDQKVQERAAELGSKTVALSQMRAEELAVKTAENSQEAATKAQKAVEESDIKARVIATQTELAASQQALLAAEYVFGNATQAPGNQALGADQHKKTKLFVSGSTSMQKSAYLKFSLHNSLRGGVVSDEDAIREAELKFYKVVTEEPHV
jgi:hypothetical protein